MSDIQSSPYTNALVSRIPNYITSKEREERLRQLREEPKEELKEAEDKRQIAINDLAKALARLMEIDFEAALTLSNEQVESGVGLIYQRI